MGMGGTQRLLHFVRLLPQFGWQPYVITVKDITYHAHDPQLLQALSDAQIFRTESLDPARLLEKIKHSAATTSDNTSPASGKFQKILYKLLRFFLIPDTKILWSPFARRAAQRLLHSQKFDLIFSSGPPHSCHLLARKIARKYQIPWVADFRDGWADGDFQQNKTGFHRWCDRLLQRKVTAAADQLIAVSNGLKAILATENETPVSLITNGFDASCFSQNYRPSSRFELVHSGSVGNFVNPDMLLAALQKFASKFGHAAFHMRFVGADLTGELSQKIAAAGLSSSVECTGYLPHEQAVDLLQKADLLIYIISGQASAGFIPGKTFEYMAAKRPILAISAVVEGVQLLLKTGLARHVQNVDEIFRTLCEVYDSYLQKVEFQANDDLIAQFEWRQLAAKLARVFGTLVAKAG